MSNKIKFLPTCALFVFILTAITACGLNTETNPSSSQTSELQNPGSQSAEPLTQQDSHEQLKPESLDTLQQRQQTKRKESQRAHSPAARKTTPLEIEEDDMPRLD